MGLSLVCSFFEYFLSLLYWIVNNKLGIKGCVYMLDDFLLVGLFCFFLCIG